MRKRTKIAIAFVVVLAIAGAAVYVTLSNVDAIVKLAIERYGSRATGTAVRVESVHVELKKGEATLSGFTVGNPEGFSGNSAFRAGSITVGVVPKSVTTGTIVLNRVHVTAPRVIYEINEAGRANIDVIRKHLENQAGEEAPAERGGGKNILIRELVAEKGRVDLRVAARPGKTYRAELPSVRLTDVGGEGGASPTQIAVQVLRPLAARAAQAAIRAGAGTYLGKSAEDVKKMLRERAREELGEGASEGTGEALRDLLGR
ncbi:MAG: hypothetical protein P8Y75_12975 [Nitrospirota bacterium]